MVWILIGLGFHSATADTVVDLASVSESGTTVHAVAPASRQHTWWFPEGVSQLVLPVSGGVHCAWPSSPMAALLRRHSSWDLKELPLVGVRYGDRMLAVMVPWPHYAELVFADRVGIRFKFPVDRNNVTPCDLHLRWTDLQPLSVAREFRDWREHGEDIGALPRPRSLSAKKAIRPEVGMLPGAPHFYLWGPSGFSRHDVRRQSWVAFAQEIEKARPGTVLAGLRERFSAEEKSSLTELAAADWPLGYLTVAVAAAIDRGLLPPLLQGAEEANFTLAFQRNRLLFYEALKSYLAPPEQWGDGLSIPLLESLSRAGIDHGLLVMSDLYGSSARPEVVSRARELGFLVGPYDSYHSVHSPAALPDDTWETAQFDQFAFESGRVVKAPGRRQSGFKGRGFHLAPTAAWPYVRKRVQLVRERNDYSAWFIDCDATAECFDDYHPLHPGTRVDDTQSRRHRLRWLIEEQGLVVGSEGGSVLFSDVIHFGHGVHTPYIGHLHPGFRDRESPYYLGRHWPPDSPEQSFKPVPLPEGLRLPYFDPTLRIPLYQAAIGDQVIATHHWSFDSLKLSNLAKTRALLEILYAVPPMYHLNREMWPKRKEAILHHVSFWGPLHRFVALRPLSSFTWLTEDRMVQQTAFGSGETKVSVTVNFDANAWEDLPPLSARVSGIAELEGRIYTTR